MDRLPKIPANIIKKINVLSLFMLIPYSVTHYITLSYKANINLRFKDMTYNVKRLIISLPFNIFIYFYRPGYTRMNYLSAVPSTAFYQSH